ncbi:MAG TPA: hypothetical protein VFX14_13965 [Methylomirabilota bacterium]|nr:hypothetical protein [Methylomirabilota bacterium]
MHFETSRSAAAQPALDRAVAMLHSFWFQMALGAFGEVAKIDPTCGRAHWGQAMTGWAIPWPGPRSHVGSPRAAVQRAKAMGAKTPREMAYIGAVEAFYKDADKVDHRIRALA